MFFKNSTITSNANNTSSDIHYGLLGGCITAMLLPYTVCVLGGTCMFCAWKIVGNLASRTHAPAGAPPVATFVELNPENSYGTMRG